MNYTFRYLSEILLIIVLLTVPIAANAKSAQHPGTKIWTGTIDFNHVLEGNRTEEDRTVIFSPPLSEIPKSIVLSISGIQGQSNNPTMEVSVVDGSIKNTGFVIHFGTTGGGHGYEDLVVTFVATNGLAATAVQQAGQ